MGGPGSGRCSCGISLPDHMGTTLQISSLSAQGTPRLRRMQFLVYILHVYEINLVLNGTRIILTRQLNGAMP